MHELGELPAAVPCGERGSACGILGLGSSLSLPAAMDVRQMAASCVQEFIAFAAVMGSFKHCQAIAQLFCHKVTYYFNSSPGFFLWLIA